MDAKLNRRPSLKVADVMEAVTLRVEPHDTIGEAVKLMWESEVRHLPVCEGDRVVGILSDRDLLRYLPRPAFGGGGSEDTTSLTRPVTHAMSEKLVSVGPTEPARTAVELMLEYGIHAVLVVEGDDRLLGIVSSTDILEVAKVLL